MLAGNSAIIRETHIRHAMTPERWLSVKHIYHAVSECLPGEREALHCRLKIDNDRLMASAQDEHELVHGFIELCAGDPARAIEDDAGIRREQPVRPDSAALIETADVKIGHLEGYGILIRSRLTGDLTQNNIFSRKFRDHQRRTAFRLREVREWKVQDDNIASYKPAQAASSPGASQSFEREDSAAAVGRATSAWRSVSARSNARILSRSCSGSRCNSRSISSRLPTEYPTSMVVHSASDAEAGEWE